MGQQLGRNGLAQGRGVPAFGSGAQDPATVRRGHEAAQQQGATGPALRQGRYRQAAVTSQGLVHGAFGVYAKTGFRVVEGGDEGAGSSVIPTNFDANGSLSHSREGVFHRERGADPFRQTQALETGGGEDDGVIETRIHLAQAGGDIAAQVVHLQMGKAGQQLRPAAQAGTADPRARREGGGVRIAGGDEGVTHVFPDQDGGDLQPRRLMGGDVFHGMNGQIHPAIQERVLDFLDKEALAADGVERDVQESVTAGGERNDLHGGPRVEAEDAVAHVFRLPEGQGAGAGADAKRSLHGDRRGLAGVDVAAHSSAKSGAKGSRVWRSSGGFRYSPTRWSMEDKVMSEKLWGGRFSTGTDSLVEEFSASIAVDRRLYAQDILGSMAHARMLGRVGVLTPEEAATIVSGLGEVRSEIEAGRMAFRPALEDIHMHIESRLTELVGEVGKKLHTARSRNDQVATDLRLYAREALDDLRGAVGRLQEVFIDLAEREADTVMPGFTHMQVAQPVSFGHHCLAYVEMLHRDSQRLADARTRVNVLPLGAAALAGTTFPIDRWDVARQLGFAAIAENSLDAVSDRDFVMEILADLAILAVHLSRLAEELILWMSPPFAFIDLPDSFCTGSSIMPQKKNPDVAELVRGKSGRVIGDLVALLVLMKGQPLAYNRDNQEDKEGFFDALDSVRASVEILARMLPGLTVQREAMRAQAEKGFATATDLADYLVRKGMPFRDAHAVVGRAVRLAQERAMALEAMPLADLQALSPLISEDVYAVLTLEGSLNARRHPGGTAPETVRAAATRARVRLHREQA